MTDHETTIAERLTRLEMSVDESQSATYDLNLEAMNLRLITRALATTLDQIESRVRDLELK